MKRVSILVVLLALAACEEKKAETKPEEKTPTTTGASTALPTATTAQPVAVTINESDLSTPADFEETAEKAITKTSYKTELASIEADIAKD